MALLSFLQKKEVVQGTQSNFYISLDIGTEVLKGLLFSVSEIGVEVWHSFNVKQQTKAMRSGVILDDVTVAENANLVVQKLVENLEENERPSTVVLGMAGELINGISITVNYDRGNNSKRPVSDDEERKIFNSIFSNILQNGRGELAKRLSTTEDNVEVLHITVTGVEVDRRKGQSLVGSTGREIKVFLYASFAPKKYVESVKRIVNQLNLRIGAIAAQPFAVSRSFGGSRDPSFSSIFVDVGGGTTDVAVVQEGNIIQTQMYPYGGRAFTQRIEAEMDTTYSIAESRKIKYSEGELQLDLRDQIRRIIAQDVSLWVESLQVALEHFEGITEFPTEIYMCGGGAMIPDIKEQILTYPWAKVLPFKRNPKVSLINPSRLDKVYDKSGLLVNPYDVTPASLARFFWDVLVNPAQNYLGDY